jgi:hypothetical protein
LWCLPVNSPTQKKITRGKKIRSENLSLNKKFKKGFGWSSEEECLPSTHEALGSIRKYHMKKVFKKYFSICYDLV